MRYIMPTCGGISAVLLALFLTACAGTINPETGEREPGLFAKIASATVEDAQVAMEINCPGAGEANYPAPFDEAFSCNGGDVSGYTCGWTIRQVALEQGGSAVISIEPVGPLSTVAAARRVRMFAQEGIDERIRSACAVVVLDTIRTGARLVGAVIPIPGASLLAR